MAGDGPEDVYLIGVTGEQLDVGAPLSDSVRNAIPLTVEMALQRVALHGGTYHKRETPLDTQIWWESAQVSVSV
jgi:hypothetical protein